MADNRPTTDRAPFVRELIQAGLGGGLFAVFLGLSLVAGSWPRHVPEETAQADSARITAYDLNTLLRRAEDLKGGSDALVGQAEQLEALPTIFPTLGSVSSAYSRSRLHPILRRVRPHEGIDIAAPRGTPIRAAAKGRVKRVGRYGSYGLMIELDHGNGYVTRYAHASRVLVRRGQVVERGEKIGEVGSTGLAGGPHLHYEVLVNGRRTDPQAFILDLDSGEAKGAE